MPKILTTLKINTNGETVFITIDESCDRFAWSDRNKAERIKKFLKFIFNILRYKPEIISAPVSDIWYI